MKLNITFWLKKDWYIVWTKEYKSEYYRRKMGYQEITYEQKIKWVRQKRRKKLEKSKRTTEYKSQYNKNYRALWKTN